MAAPTDRSSPALTLGGRFHMTFRQAIIDDDRDWIQNRILAGMPIELDMYPVLDPKITKSEVPLHFAAALGRTEIVEMLLNRRASVDILSHLLSQPFGNTPMYNAALNGHVDTMRLLLDKGASLRLFASGGRVPVHVLTAIARNSPCGKLLSPGHVECIKHLLNKSQEVGCQKNEYTESILKLAIQSESLELLKAITLHSDRLKNTLVWASAHSESHELLSHLIAAGASDEAPFVALCSAAYRGKVDMVDALLSAIPDTEGYHSSTAICFAVYNLKAGATQGELKNCVKILRKLAAHRFSILATSSVFGRTPLHCAADSPCNTSVLVRFFTKLGAKAEEETVPCPKRERKDFAILTRMFEDGLTHRNFTFKSIPANQNALHVCAAGLAPKAVRVLLSKAPELLESEDSDGLTPLLLCVYSMVASLSPSGPGSIEPEKLEILELLLEAGADVNAQRYGMAAVNICAQRRPNETVAALIPVVDILFASDNSRVSTQQVRELIARGAESSTRAMRAHLKEKLRARGEDLELVSPRPLHDGRADHDDGGPEDDDIEDDDGSNVEGELDDDGA